MRGGAGRPLDPRRGLRYLPPVTRSWNVGATAVSPLIGAKPELEQVPEKSADPLLEAPIGPTPPLVRRNAEARDFSSTWPDRAVTAVLLGATGGGAVLGAPVIGHAAQLDVFSPPDPLAVAGVADAARTLDGAREEMSAVELAEARRELWSAFAAATTPSAASETPLTLGAAVGAGRANQTADVLRVQERLAELGFDVKVDGDYGSNTLRGIRLYEAIVTGREHVSDTTGFITPGGLLHRALASPDSVRWQRLPASGTGFVNTDTDGFSWATDRLVQVVISAGERYQQSHRDAHPGAARIGLNDASRRAGGNNADHETHETGLDLDVRLPRTDGTHGTIAGAANYDREATYRMIAAFASDPRVERILFSDNVLLQRIANSNASWKHKVAHGGAVHRDHIHVDVSPPPAPAPAATGRVARG